MKRIGLNFQMEVWLGGYLVPESGVHDFGCGLERSIAFEIERDMEMDAPECVGILRGCRRCQRLIQIGKPGPIQNFYLVEIHRIQKYLQPFSGWRSGEDLKCGTELDLGDPDAMPDKSCQAGGQIFKLQGQMAGVKTDADMPSDDRLGFAPGAG